MRLVDFAAVLANDWLVVNQLTVIEGHHNRRPDLVVFVNGLPLAVIELKNAADQEAKIWNAYAQLQTYKAEIPSLLHYNAALVVSDGLKARMGSVTANQEWFKVWRTIDGEGDAAKSALELEVLVRGVFERRRFLELLQHFILFEEDPDTGAIHKIIAGYHQFHAVNAAVEETVRASGKPAERLSLIPAGQEHILELDDGKKRWVQVVTELSRAFALCAASDEATAIRDDVSFFQALQAALNKQDGGNRKTPEQVDAAIRQLVSKAITTDGQVIDVFTAAGLPKPDISILSDQFLAEVRGLKHKNVAAELLEKLLKDELKTRSQRNVVQSQVFSDKLKKTLNA